jgi:hypothetical protein
MRSAGRVGCESFFILSGFAAKDLVLIPVINEINPPGKILQLPPTEVNASG